MSVPEDTAGGLQGEGATGYCRRTSSKVRVPQDTAGGLQGEGATGYCRRTSR